MLGRISRGIGHKSGGKKGTKYRFDIVIEKLDNLPGPVKKCRVVWSRGAKLQMTSIKDVNKGAVLFKEQLSQIATMYQDAKGAFEPKEYKFQVQVPGKEDNKLLTVGRADLDMAHYALSEGTAQSKMIPILFKVGMASTGYLKVSITAHVVASGTDSDDGMTEVSGMTGMTASLGDDQDLTGFDEDRSAQPSSGGHSGANSRPSSRLSTAATSPTKPDSKAAAAAVAATGKVSTSSTVASKAKTAPKAAAKGGDDDEISPLSLSPASSGGSSPRTTSSTQPVRSAGKPSVVDKDARAQLFGTAPSKPSKPAASNSSSSSKMAEAPLSEEEARAALFGSATVGKRPSAPAAAASSSSSKSSKPTAAPDSGKAASTSKSAASASSTLAASTTSPSDGGAGPSSTPVVRRALLDRSALQEKQQAQAAAPSSDVSTSSSKRAAATPNTYQHSLSDSDDDSIPEQQAAAGNTKQQAAQARAAPNTAASRQKQQPMQQQQQQPQQAAPQQAATDTSIVTCKALTAEVEKLKAQVVALRQQAGDAEESRRMAVLAADNAASERDEYRSQVQELQEQLKEALVSLMTPEEAASLREEVQALQQQLKTQQAEQEEQQRVHNAAVRAWQEGHKQLQQQVQDAQDAQLAAQQAQQDAARQTQHLQADADSHAGLMRHLSWQLEAAQQALVQQHQQQGQEQVPTQGAAGIDGGDPSPSALAAELSAAQARASSAERQCAQVLQVLADEAAALTPQGLVTHFMSDQLLEGVSSTIATLELDGGVQGPVMEVLGTPRAAAAAALQHMEAEQASLNTRLVASEAALVKVQRASDNLQQQCSSQASRAAADLQHLHAEVAQLQQENVQLVMKAAAPTSLKLGVQPGEHEQPSSPRIMAAMQPTGLAGTDIGTDSGCRTCAGLRQQLSAAQQKAMRLTAARDKLELILHDLEAASAEEQQQQEHQLAAANKALRATGQQLAAVQQELTRTQAELSDTQQQRDAAAQQLALVQQEHEAALQQQSAHAAAAELQEQGQIAAAAAAQASIVHSKVDTAAQDSAAQVIAMAESAGPSGIEQALAAAQDQVADLQRQLAEAETTRRGLEKQLGRARKQLADEQAERSTLEEHMINRLEELGDDGAQETVAAYEAKYNRLKSRYRELTEVHREEVDKLHDEIASLQEHVVELEAQTAQLEAAKAQAQHGEVTLADTLAKAGKASSELAALRVENMELMQTLVHTKMELALCCEREVVGRHELYKARETNLKLASKMTKLETLVYSSKK